MKIEHTLIKYRFLIHSSVFYKWVTSLNVYSLDVLELQETVKGNNCEYKASGDRHSGKLLWKEAICGLNNSAVGGTLSWRGIYA